MPSEYTGGHTSQYRTELAACPHITPAQAQQYADRGIDDALDLIVDTHELDPRQVYGRLVKWGRDSPARLVTAALALAAMHDPDTPGQQLANNLHATTDPRNAAA